jgi:putative membrane protein
MRGNRIPLACLGVFLAVWILLAIDPRYPEDWLLENLPTFVLVPLAVLSFRRTRLSDRACVQATIFAILHTIGSHYTYSEMPLGNWVRDAFDLSRNHYDRFVHFSFGVLMLRPLRELAIGNVRLGLFSAAYLGISLVALWSGLYEIVEWITASLADPAAGTAFLGTQGDVWDAQKDMILALTGGLFGLLVEVLTAKRWAGIADAS